jgi:hypothetical protein
MSAYVVKKEHIDLLAEAATQVWAQVGALKWYSLGPDQLGEIHWTARQEYYRDALHMSKDDIGQLLLDENVKSVAYRYNDSSGDDLPGDEVREYHYEPTGLRGEATPQQILQACQGYDYQSCEHPKYRSSEAFQLLEAIKSRQIHLLTAGVEGFWDFDKKRYHEGRQEAAEQRRRLEDDHIRRDEDARATAGQGRER